MSYCISSIAQEPMDGSAWDSVVSVIFQLECTRAMLPESRNGRTLSHRYNTFTYEGYHATGIFLGEEIARCAGGSVTKAPREAVDRPRPCRTTKRYIDIY